MKIRVLNFAAILIMSISTVLAQGEKNEKFKVAGNCNLCKTRIEKAANSVKGVSFANWDKETKMLEVKYDEAKTNVHQLHMAIAKAGHDTEMHKASQEAYDNLPACCRYERLGSEKNGSHDPGDH